MSRRTTSLVVSGVLLVMLVVVAFSMPMPYVVESPGITENTLGELNGKPVIEIEGAKTYPVDGHLELTTVSVSRQDYEPRLPDVLSAWIADDQIVLPRDYVYPPEKSTKEV
ncbi:MAG: PDZ/DHR/GLGF domain-containing protein, partial [Actinomycetota bacterium]|nr:PDZ/DHR/GLGF domain-containing protein [Actinomycetota bacterium]